MLEVLMYIVAGLAAIIAIILVLASRRPDAFSTSRTLRIAAPTERLFGLINNLHEMNRWNPYALRETSGTTTYSGPESGKGAHFDFAGTKSGSGFIEIIDNSPPTSVVMRLMMLKPMQADNRIEFSIRPSGAACDVSWTMSGSQPLFAKVFGMFVDCDKMVGRDFEAGLANLKAIAEN